MGSSCGSFLILMPRLVTGIRGQPRDGSRLEGRVREKLPRMLTKIWVAKASSMLFIGCQQGQYRHGEKVASGSARSGMGSCPTRLHDNLLRGQNQH